MNNLKVQRDHNGNLETVESDDFVVGRFSTTIKHPKGRSMDFLKDYFKKHQDVLMTVLFVMIIDHYFLKGSLKGKLQKLLDGILSETTKKLGQDE